MRDKTTDLLSNHPKLTGALFTVSLVVIDSGTIDLLGNGHPGP